MTAEFRKVTTAIRVKTSRTTEELSVGARDTGQGIPSATAPYLAIRSSLRYRDRERRMKVENGQSTSSNQALRSLKSKSLASQTGPKFEPYRPPKKPHMPKRTIAVVNASGRQAASFIRVASAVGYNVQAQLRNLDGIVANEINDLPNVETFVGELADPESGIINTDLINDVFNGAHLAFINTTMYGNEFQIGCFLAYAAARSGVQHYIYSSMPDHSAHDPFWPSLPLWSVKAKVEAYIRASLPNLPSTFVYTGIYNNNFTSLPYPLFCMELQYDGSFEWKAPFHPDAKLPWLDAEHDFGPAVLQIFKDGVRKWGGRKVPLAFELLTPREACNAFARGISRTVRYVQGPIEVTVPIPNGYKKQLEALEALYSIGNGDAKLQPRYFGEAGLESRCPEEALHLWEGYRSLEEYAREVFPLEEAANGLTWMNEDNEFGLDRVNYTNEDEDDEDSLTIGGGKRREEDWLA